MSGTARRAREGQVSRRALLGALASAPLASLGCGSPVVAPPPVAAASGAERTASAPSRERALRERLERARLAAGAPSLVVAATDRRGPLFFESLGEPTTAGAATLDTVFPLASISKALTTTALATLVRDGLLAWDEPLAGVAPVVRLHPRFDRDPPSVRDVLTHRLGFAPTAGDLLWYMTSATWDGVRPRLRALVPEAPIRSTFGYSTVMVSALREVFPVRAGATWDAAMQRRVAGPLGLGSVITTDEQAEARLAQLVRRSQLDGESVPAPLQPLDAVAPGAGVRASFADVLAFGRALLDGDRPDAWLGAALLEELWQPYVPHPLSTLRRRRMPELHSRAVGMGCFVAVYGGRRVVYHDGLLPGSSTVLAWLPDDGLAVAAYVGTEAMRLLHAVLHTLLDEVLDRPRTDWAARFEALRDEALAERPKASTPETSPLSEGVAELVRGTYVSPLYGRLDVAGSGAETVVRLERHATVRGQLRLKADRSLRCVWQPEHWGESDWEIVSDAGPSGAPLPLDPRAGRVRAFRCRFRPDMIDGATYTFERVEPG